VNVEDSVPLLGEDWSADVNAVVEFVFEEDFLDPDLAGFFRRFDEDDCDCVDEFGFVVELVSC